ncbi:type II secretion system protein [Coraliomargarita sp. SDUM461004]|uniref:Type II secretion system protein n=1 Tax=Thalassobacterium sedimentorum TaxID=3041258 RepID=A0ABU1AIQ3_9BACT|nr:type II secretion system protein [Coraliomargarita sp. SDUM461004]MDQ8194690.1 type II secretion system protein [Coraliomargarita sp. SDUM461004]
MQHIYKLNRFRGFTLVELLMVIAVIAVLAAILIPVITRVREKSHEVECRNNLRQIGVALNLYVQDHNQRFPGPLTGAQPTSYKLGVTNAMVYHLTEYLGLPEPTEEKQYAEVFACPAYLAEKPIEEDPRSYVIPTGSETGYLFGYANADPNKGQGAKTITYAYQENPHDIWILREASQLQSGNIRLPEQPNHKEGNHYLFLDGSVRMIAFDQELY